MGLSGSGRPRGKVGQERGLRLGCKNHGIGKDVFMEDNVTTNIDAPC